MDTSDSITVSVQDNEDQQLQKITEAVSSLKTNVVNILAQLKELDKQLKKKERQNKKKLASADTTTKRKPTGFALPVVVSDELCKFMQKSPGTKVSRTDTTSFLIKYIKDNNLQNLENKKKIMPDETLKKLFKLDDETEYDIHFFNLQTFINHHFINSNLSA